MTTEEIDSREKDCIQSGLTGWGLGTGTGTHPLDSCDQST